LLFVATFAKLISESHPKASPNPKALIVIQKEAQNRPKVTRDTAQSYLDQ